MIDLKYHVYSLVAVFLALALGIVVGNSLATRPVNATTGKITRVERMVAALDRDFADVQSELDRKKEELRDLKEAEIRYETFSRSVLPIVLKDRLAWRNVAIIQTGDYDISGQIKTALEAAGAQVTSVTRIGNRSSFENPEAVADMITKIGLERTSSDKPGAAPIFRSVARSIVLASDQQALAKMENLKIVARSGDYTRWNRLVVVIGGSRPRQDSSEKVDVPLIQELRRIGAVVVACEPADATSSYMRTYRKTDVATIDNADRAAGQVSLVCALAGESGHYGVKRTADRLLPASIEGTKR